MGCIVALHWPVPVCQCQNQLAAGVWILPVAPVLGACAASEVLLCSVLLCTPLLCSAKHLPDPRGSYCTTIYTPSYHKDATTDPLTTTVPRSPAPPPLLTTRLHLHGPPPAPYRTAPQNTSNLQISLPVLTCALHALPVSASPSLTGRARQIGTTLREGKQSRSEAGAGAGARTRTGKRQPTGVTTSKLENLEALPSFVMIVIIVIFVVIFVVAGVQAATSARQGQGKARQGKARQDKQLSNRVLLETTATARAIANNCWPSTCPVSQ